MYLRLTDGSTNIELSQTAPVTGCTYFPSAAKRGDVSISETATVNLTGTPAALVALIESIEQLLEEAARRAEMGVGTRVFAEYRAVSTDPSYRSEILDGQVLGSENPALRRFETASGTATIQIGVLWTRRVWPDGCSWEASTETELAISSKAQSTAATGGRTIANCNDGTRGNYVEIAASQVIGSGPAPVRINLKNSSGATQNYTNFYFATNAQSDPANFTHFLEGEARTSGGTVTANGSSSGGSYNSFAVTGSGTGILWSLPSAVTNGGEGRTFRLLARLLGNPGAPIYATPMIKDNGGLIPLATGVEVKIDTSGFLLIDLGELPIPPGAVDATSLAPLTLYLALRCDTSATLQLDYIQLTPTESLRHLYQRGYGVANNDFVEDDGILGQAYALSGTNKYPIHIQLGKPVMVWPNTLQRIYFLFDSDFGASPVAATSVVRLFYRPRRRTV